jgi:hypothetical protein
VIASPTAPQTLSLYEPVLRESRVESLADQHRTNEGFFENYKKDNPYYYG